MSDGTDDIDSPPDLTQEIQLLPTYLTAAEYYAAHHNILQKLQDSSRKSIEDSIDAQVIAWMKAQLPPEVSKEEKAHLTLQEVCARIRKKYRK